MKNEFKTAIAGFCAGAVNGLFGAGGGMLLVQLLTVMKDIEEETVFSSSVSIILPICLTSILFSVGTHGLPWQMAFPYLAGSIMGGFLAAKADLHIRITWMHRALGILILWGGIRYLC